MNILKRLTVVLISALVLSSNVLNCMAEDLVWPEGAKEDILNLAKEQDRFVLLFVGNYNCSLCKHSWGLFNDDPLRQIVEENYYTWFFSYYQINTSIRSDYEEVKIYIADYDANKALPADDRKPYNFPILALINPNDPDEDYTIYWAGGARKLEELYGFIANPPDLFAGNELTWYNDADKNEIIKLAKEQGKHIFKMVGKTTSPNTKKVLKQLNEEPLKSMLEDNYILWFSDIPVVTRSAGENEKTLSLPYISIIYPEHPNTALEEETGYQDVESLEEMIKKYTVSNEKIIDDNQVNVMGNVIRITNGNNKEQIKIFSLSGQQVASIRKNDFSIRIDATAYPKGVLIVNSSSGWSKKIVVH